MPQNREKRATMSDTQQLPFELDEKLLSTITGTLDKMTNPDKDSLLSQGNLEQAGEILNDLTPILVQAIQSAEATYKAELIQKIEKMESLNVFGNFCGTADGEMLINKKKVLAIIKGK